MRDDRGNETEAEMLYRNRLVGFDDHGEDAGLVAGNDHRDVAVDGHFSLEQLLAGGIHVGGVGEGDAAAELLLHRDARGGVAEARPDSWDRL